MNYRYESLVVPHPSRARPTAIKYRVVHWFETFVRSSRLQLHAHLLDQADIAVACNPPFCRPPALAGKSEGDDTRR